jgi:hypothetical protein
MRLIAGGFETVGSGQMLQLIEVASPAVRDRTGIIKVRLVELLDIGGIAAVKIRIG